MNNQEQNPTTEDMFCIDDLMSEMRTYAIRELQKIGKTNIEAETYPYIDGTTCWIVADRSRLRQILIILLDDVVKYIGKGFTVFGYFVHDTAMDGIDIYVDDTRCSQCTRCTYGGKYNNEDDLSIVRGLVEQMGSHLKDKKRNCLGSSYMFFVKGFTKLVKTPQS
jgi:hypothetical protein